ncbi:hypothetical protein DPMN_121734 [Dreissena polymorpha]|uniref:Reverse transcriptase domain-containing protein n=1 Tax=Dreissena polymorpha TaxID=45954 RepID=A0A9D4GR84_DREPO|nr:hypothetical protein DPMN_121734 [Dreissena polymorpha]
MFADDIAAAAETASKLQIQINRIHEFCEATGMQLNLDKSKIIVFRNGAAGGGAGGDDGGGDGCDGGGDDGGVDGGGDIGGDGGVGGGGLVTVVVMVMLMVVVVVIMMLMVVAMVVVVVKMMMLLVLVMMLVVNVVVKVVVVMMPPGDQLAYRLAVDIAYTTLNRLDERPPDDNPNKNRRSAILKIVPEPTMTNRAIFPKFPH